SLGHAPRLSGGRKLERSPDAILALGEPRRHDETSYLVSVRLAVLLFGEPHQMAVRMRHDEDRRSAFLKIHKLRVVQGVADKGMTLKIEAVHDLQFPACVEPPQFLIPVIFAKFDFDGAAIHAVAS